jgi:hypothetical protein
MRPSNSFNVLLPKMSHNPIFEMDLRLYHIFADNEMNHAKKTTNIIFI